MTISVSYGNGRHFAVLSLEQKEGAVKWMISAYVPGIMSLGFPKLAVISLLTKLLAPAKFHTWILWIMGVLSVAGFAAVVTILMLQCSPPESLWNLTAPKHDCLPIDVLIDLSYAVGREWSKPLCTLRMDTHQRMIRATVLSVFLDFYLAIYPAIILFSLQMRTYKKIGLSCALGMGLM